MADNKGLRWFIKIALKHKEPFVKCEYCGRVVYCGPPCCEASKKNNKQ